MQIKTRIDQLVHKHGTLRGAARATGVDVGYLSRLRKGSKAQPSDEVLERLGLQRVVSYRLSGATMQEGKA